jgi:hypothetical protein
VRWYIPVTTTRQEIQVSLEKKKQDPIQKTTKAKRIEGVAQVVSTRVLKPSTTKNIYIYI